ncbi:MAG TPA: hypothetical protein VMT76_13865 [Puia sp.]|nr:hypothetical protein [Puia sp.]
MATISSQQEILLMTGTSFSARAFCENDNNIGNKNLSEKERLEEACWNGLLHDMLPEICSQAGNTNKMYLWQIKEADSFIELELSEFPEVADRFFSIDPYNFITEKIFN